MNTFICKSCAGTHVRQGSREGYAYAIPCPDCPECAQCGGTGYVFQKDERHGFAFSAKCDECEPLRVKCDLFNRAKVPLRFSRVGLSNYDPMTTSQKEALGWFTNRARGWIPGDRSIVLSGPVGTGKTHLMCAWIKSMCFQREIECRFVEFSHMLSDIKAGFNDGRSEGQIIEPLSRVPVLIIDELGKRQSTDWQHSIMDLLISRRYEAGLSTFFATNYPFHLGEVGPSRTMTTDDFYRKTLRQVIGDRLASRLAEMCDFVTIDGPDYRQQEAVTALDPRGAAV